VSIFEKRVQRATRARLTRLFRVDDDLIGQTVSPRQKRNRLLGERLAAILQVRVRSAGSDSLCGTSRQA